ncbi:transglutaminase family protein [Labrys wisconsinensis]|uniref:Transglutaminase-like putative cysteine protease n=1 Tax=Labrys wisconsinensis TaxID=425677 RepID=A0ABU0J206_9HYPH|nr:transglutaminase family protein [Labrys wisconsinensis]MDQ0467354.1 transglutaminase-like putative cysteine protease [Labrys wisconsinensis]
MLYVIRHTTTYSYRADVSSGRCVLHLLPADAGRQRVLSATLTIDPAPAEQAETLDFFGNRTSHVRFSRPAARHRFESRVRVEVGAFEAPHALLTPAWESVRREALATADIAGGAPAHQLFASRYVPLLDAARAYARESFTPGRPVLDAAVALMRRIHADFVYESGATDVSTPLAEVAERRHGVCQDFAHWMIAGLRAIGIPAAYVSGYLRTRPPPGRPRLVGADATHAWVSVWCGAAGWVDLDPTNALVVGEDHVRLAIGRDYADVAPVGGVIMASAGHTLRVSVDVAPGG